MQCLLPSFDQNIAHFAQAKHTHPFGTGVFGIHLRPFEQNAFSVGWYHSWLDLTKFDINYAIQEAYVVEI